MKEYKFFNDIIARIPSVPFNESDDIDKDFVLQFFSNKLAKEALFIASPKFCKLFIKWQEGNLGLSNKDENKMLYTLLKYYMRMSVRCTPFGLFSSISTVKWGDSNNIKLMENSYFRETNLDMYFSIELAQLLSQKQVVKEELLFSPNSTLYKKGREYRLIEYYYNNGQRQHRLTAFDSSIYLDKILELTADKCSYRFLVYEFGLFFKIDKKQVISFIDEVIDNQLIISNLTPSLSGPNHIVQIYDVIENIYKICSNSEIKKILIDLENIKNSLLELDLKSNEINDYDIIKNKISKTFNIEIKANKFFQTNLYLKTNNYTINKSIKDDITSAAHSLFKLTSNFKHNRNSLEDFKVRFIERYESKEMPLLEVIDSESGIGYAFKDNRTGKLNTLIKEMTLGSSKNMDSINWSKTESFLFKKLQESYKNKETTIHIEKSELSSFNVEQGHFSDTLSVFFSIINDSKKSIFLGSISGSTAASLLGRYANGNNDVNKLFSEISKIEKKNNIDALVAEIIHLPEKRTGNILLRPSVREYEIPILSYSLLPIENQIKLKDILVSVRNNTIILRSKKLNKRIIPKLSNAHNYSFDSLPVYHFLSDFQFNGFRNDFHFRWGEFIGNEFIFFPRVKINNIIVSRAFWKLTNKDYDNLIKGEISITKWREKFNIPKLFYLSEGDNNLLINSNNSFLIAMFIDELKKRTKIKLIEFEFSSLFIKDEKNNGYTNEFIATIFRKGNNFKTNSLKNIDKTIKRSFFLGTTWIYFKIYCGIATSDSLLTNEIYRIYEELKRKKIIKKWFFIRYSDPDNHMRIRFLIDNSKNYTTVINIFMSYLKDPINHGHIWDIKQETYNRELERYGFATIEHAESFFHSDSVFYIQFLYEINKQNKQDVDELKWLISLRSIDVFLDSLKFSLEGRKDLLSSMKDSFASEFEINIKTKKLISKRFRDNEEKIMNVLNHNNNLYPKIYALLDERMKKDIQVSRDLDIILAKKRANNENDVLYFGIVSSYIHMMMNRFFESFNRENEMVLYYYLWRVYQIKYSKLNAKNLK